MLAMVLEQQRKPLVSKEINCTEPGEEEVLLEVEACAVCRTDLHIVDGDLKEPKLPLVPGHEIVGRIKQKGGAVEELEVGDLVGVPWLGQTCGKCRQCKANRENICENPEFTGYTRDGGFAQFTTANHRYCFKIPDNYDALHAAPLLCAGLIGWRSYKAALKNAPVNKLGIYGFGAAAHIIAQVATSQGKEVYAFTRQGDESGQDFARKLGCVWAGGSNERPDKLLDATIIFAPVGELVPIALQCTGNGGTVVCGGIHMSDIPSFQYSDLWGEKQIVSVANLTREDGLEFLSLVSRSPVIPIITEYKLTSANDALDHLRAGKVKGAAVLTP